MPDYNREYLRERIGEMNEQELAAELEAAWAHIAELKQQASSPVGYITGYHADGKWHIAFDGTPFTWDEVIVDLHVATVEVPDVAWRVLEVLQAAEEVRR